MVPFLTYLTATIFMTNVNAKSKAREANFRCLIFQKHEKVEFVGTSRNKISHQMRLFWCGFPSNLYLQTVPV